MSGHSFHETSGGNINGSLAGYGLTPYSGTIYRGYGWGRMMDYDDPFLFHAFRHEAKNIARPTKDKKEIKYPLSWH